MSTAKTEISVSSHKGSVGSSNRMQTVLFASLLGLIVAMVFWPLHSHDFLNYDDPDYVTDNPIVLQGLTAKGVSWAFSSSHSSNWHPLTWMTHMIDCQLFGPLAAGHHMTNVFFHVLNSVLLFLLFKRITGAIWSSLFVAAVFGLHPLRVESVAWIAERKDVLSGFFFMLTAWTYVRYAEAQAGEKFRSYSFYTAALIAFACGLMSKPMLVTLPFVLLLLDMWPLNRTDSPRRFLSLVLEKSPFFALSIASCIITVYAQSKGGAVATLQSLPVSERLTNAVVSYAQYLVKGFWPDRLCALYPRADWPGWIVALSGTLLVAGTVSVLLLRRKPYLFVGWFWFVGMLIPVIGLVQVGIQSMADRYTYLPLIGVSVMVAWGCSDFLGRRDSGRQLVAVFGIIAVGTCTVLTWKQLPHWRNSITLYENVLRVVSANPYLQKAIQTQASYADIYNNYGHALADAGRFQEAIAQYQNGLRLNPKHVELHDNLGNALGQTGQLKLAQQHFIEALKIDPASAVLHTDYGVALAMMGQLDPAVEQFKEGIRLNPNLASAHSNLGNALAMQRKLEQAVSEFKTALNLKPHEAHAHLNLAIALRELGRLDEAIESAQKAVILKPDNPNAHFHLGYTLAAKGRPNEATACYENALKIDPNFPPAAQELSRLRAK